MQNSCIALIVDTQDNTKTPTKSSPPSITYFLNISIPTKKSTSLKGINHPKFRIKIPKLLAKSVKKNVYLHQNNLTNKQNNRKMKNKYWVNPKKLKSLHIHKLTSLLSTMIMSNKLETIGNGDTTPIEEDEETEQKRANLNGSRALMEESKSFRSTTSSLFSLDIQEDPCFQSSISETSSLFSLDIEDDPNFCSSVSETSSLFSLDIGDGKYFPSPKSSLLDKIHCPNENFKIEEKEEDGGIGGGAEPIESNEEVIDKTSTIFEIPMKASSSNRQTLSSLIEKDKSESVYSSNCCKGRGMKEEVSRKSSGSTWKRFKYLTHITEQKVKEEKKKEDENEHNDEDQLCKKRILMGLRCKPLNVYSHFSL